MKAAKQNIYVVSNSRLLEKDSIIGWTPDLLVAMTCRQQYEASFKTRCYVKECRKITFETDFPNMEDMEIMEVNFHMIPARYESIYRKCDEEVKLYYTDLIRELKNIRSFLTSKKERKTLKKTIDLLERLYEKDVETIIDPIQCEESMGIRRYL